MAIKNIEEIAEKYKNVFNSFFMDEEVKKAIIQSHMGTEKYNDKLKEYDEIMKKIVFVPYVQLKDLQKFIDEKKCQYNDDKDFINEYKDIIDLTHRLTLKYNKIYTENFKALYNNILEKYPDIMREISIDKNANTGNMEDNFKLLMEAVKVNSKKLTNNFNNRFKINKIVKQIEKCERITKEKAFMETSTFYQNKRNMNDETMDTDVIDNSTTYIKNRIRKTENKKIERKHYIYIPVMRMGNREKLMIAVAHEVSHGVKGIINGNKYSSGFARYKIGNTRKQKITADGNIYDANIYNQFEEFSHHYMTRESMGMNNKEKSITLNKKWNDLCEINSIPSTLFVGNSFPPDYEFNDNISSKFVEKLRSLIQDLNSGRINREQFSKYVGGNDKTKKVALLSIERMKNQSEGIKTFLSKMNGEKSSLKDMIKNAELQNYIKKTNEKSLELENEAIQEIDEMSEQFGKNKQMYIENLTKKTKASKVATIGKEISNFLNRRKNKSVINDFEK